MTIERKEIREIVQVMLEPVARLCVQHAVSIRELLEIMKQILLKAAAEMLILRGEKINTSRLSAATGLQRKDVVRLRDSEEIASERPQALASRVVGQWESDSRFTTKSGQPRVLSIYGDRNEFRELVESISTDLNSGTLLFELERLGSVARTRGGVKLLRKGVDARTDVELGLNILAQDIRDLAASVQDNLSSDTELPQLHVRTEYDNIVEERLDDVKEWLLNEANAYHEKVRNYLAQFDKDIHPELTGKGGGRVVFTTFSRTTAFEGESFEGESDEQKREA